MATRLTEHEAVNEILSLLGRRPVNSLLAADLTPDASFALAEVRHTSRQVQNVGWHWNTRYSVQLLKNGSNRIPLATNIARVDSAKRYGPRTFGVDPIMRSHPTDGMCLFDKLADARDADGFDWSNVDQVRMDIVELLDFEQTPDSFRHYVTIRAGRAVQARIIGDPALYRFSLDDEARALQILMREELDTSDANALHARGIRSFTRRRSPLGHLESL